MSETYVDRVFAEMKRSAAQKALLAVGRGQRNAIKRVDDYLSLMDSQNRTEAMLDLLHQADSALFWRIMRRWWTSCDATSWAQQEALTDLMSLYQLGAPRNAPRGSQLQLYRGCSRSRVLAISWSLSESVARGFARGHRGIGVLDPVIATVRVPRDHVLLYLNDRQEQDALLLPDMLHDVRVVPFLGQAEAA